MTMLSPEQDLSDRRPVWDALQEFWMDTDPEICLRYVAEDCARSKYAIAELEQIFWNEVRPAVGFNLDVVAGEWAGFDPNWLAIRILARHRFGRALPMKFLHRDEDAWWTRLRLEVERIRSAQ